MMKSQWTIISCWAPKARRRKISRTEFQRINSEMVFTLLFVFVFVFAEDVNIPRCAKNNRFKSVHVLKFHAIPNHSQAVSCVSGSGFCYVLVVRFFFFLRWVKDGWVNNKWERAAIRSREDYWRFKPFLLPLLLEVLPGVRHSSFDELQNS